MRIEPKNTRPHSTCVAACCPTASLSSAASCSSSCRRRRRRAAVAPHAAPRPACPGCWQPRICTRAPEASAAAPQAEAPLRWHPNPEPPRFRCRASPPQRAQAAPGMSRDVSRTVTFGWLRGSSLARVASARRSCCSPETFTSFAELCVMTAKASPPCSCKSHFFPQMFASTNEINLPFLSSLLTLNRRLRKHGGTSLWHTGLQTDIHLDRTHRQVLLPTCHATKRGAVPASLQAKSLSSCVSVCRRGQHVGLQRPWPLPQLTCRTPAKAPCRPASERVAACSLAHSPASAGPANCAAPPAAARMHVHAACAAGRACAAGAGHAAWAACAVGTALH